MSKATTRGRLSLGALSLLIALLTALFVGAGATTASAAPRTATPAPVAINQVTSAQSIVGTFNVSRFANQNGQLTAMGTFTGTVTQSARAGIVSQTASQQVGLPVNVQQKIG